MNKRFFSAIIGLIAALMFTTAAAAQGKATTPAPAQQKASAAMTAATQEKAAVTTPAPTQEMAAAAMTAPTKAMKSETFNGVVEGVDTAKNSVAVEYHKDRMTFTVNDKTKLYEGGKTLKLAEVNKGLWASVEYQRQGNELVAQSIHVGPAKQPMKTASAKGMTESKMTSSSKATGNK
jgi:hypothetical protein